VLTSEEQEKLKTRTRKCKSPYEDVIRAKIVLLAAGLSDGITTTRLDTPRRIVRVAQQICLSVPAGPAGETSLTMRFLDKVSRTPATDCTYCPITPDDLAHAPIREST